MRNLAGKPGFSNHLPQLQGPGFPLHDIQEISLLEKADCNLVEFMAWLRLVCIFMLGNLASLLAVSTDLLVTNVLVSAGC